MTYKTTYARTLSTLFAMATLFVCGGLHAQTTDMGGPVSWQLKLSPAKAAKTVLPSIDIAQLEAEDAVNNATKAGPWRFGFEHLVGDDFRLTGQWTVLDGGRLWRKTYTAPEAITMNVYFDVFHLVEGASVHVFSGEGPIYDGAYTAANNQPDGMLSTIPIHANSITVEYFEPLSVVGESSLVIGHVVQGYREIGDFVQTAKTQAKSLNGSGACNYDTKCSDLPGNPFGSPGAWDGPIASVALMLNNGSSICSAALVNNTAGDGTPYVLSANHCGTTNGGGRAFLFGWESPTAVCATTGNSANGPTTNQINGATLRANRSGSDFALWEMSTVPPPSYGVYYAGWDRSGNIPTQATGIHHPSGDVKKMCRESDSPYQSSTAGAQVWWIDEWEFGVTEPGSSGSPLFDQNQRIIGQLYGGLAACSGTSNNGQYDYYGRFNVSWDAGSSSSARLKEWLDPTGTNPMAIDGYDPNTPVTDLDAGILGIQNLNGYYCNETDFNPDVTLRNYGLNTLTSAQLTYSLNGAVLGSQPWTGSLASGQSVVVDMPVLTVATSGTYTYSVSVSNPNGGTDENPANDVAASNFTVALNATQAQLALTFDCWANETSWNITDAGGATVYSGDGYPGNLDGQTINETFCLGEGCYTFNIYDSFGDGMHGTNYSSCDYDGDYSITDGTGNVLVQMSAPNADFGSQASHSFCIGDTAVPCKLPYPVATNLSSSVLANGVQLNWDPIIGSVGCRIQGGIAPSGGLQTIQTLGSNLNSFFVSEGQLSGGNTYRWRVQCGCSTSVVGDWSPWNEFVWGGKSIASKGAFGGGELALYPNPASTTIQLSLGGFAGGEVRTSVYNALGAKVLNETSKAQKGDYTASLDIDGLQPGIYIVVLETGNTIFGERFVKQ